MPRRVITVPDTPQSRRAEDTEAIIRDAKRGSGGKRVPPEERGKWVLRGLAAEKRRNRWAREDKAPGATADDALRHAMRLMEEARRMK